MAPVALSFVVRFSSEDAIFKAENLCKGKADNLGTWKIAKEDMSCGRMEAEFQLEKASYISHVDVGNCGSAFIEILVGNSMWPQDKPYVTLLPSAMLMSPAECKHWTKTHTVRMFNQSAFSKRALGSQWDRIRVICRQPFRKDKQFGLSFMRMASVPDEPTSSPSEGASGKVATPRSGHLSEEETDEDGVMRLKKASGLMGCLRNFEKGSPEIPLNRAGKMLQAALDVRSPGTPRNKRTLSQSSSEISSSPESPVTKNFQSPSEEPKEKRKKKEKNWSLSGDIYEEVALFLEEINFTQLDLHHITFKDLKDQMEEQRGCPLTKLERKVFLELAKAAITKVAQVEDETEDVVEAPTTKPKEPDETGKHRSRSSSSETLASRKMENKIKKAGSSQPSTSTALSPNVKSQRLEKPVHEIHHVDLLSASSKVLVIGDDDDNDEDDLPPMLYSSEQKMHSRQKVLADKSPASSMVECPLCNCLFPAKEVEFHAAFCTGHSDTKTIIVQPEVELMQCPICSKLFPVSQIEQHADECVEATITECNNNIRREPVTT